MVSSMALSSAIKFISLCEFETKKLFTIQERVDLLIVDDRRGADKFIDFGVTLPAQFGNVRFRLLDGLSGPVRHSPTHIADSLETGHLIFDRGFAGQKIRLLRT